MADRLLTLISLCLVLAGCMPSSCSRTESRDISASDSLSRAYATGLPVDTLVLDRTTPPDAFDHPRTVAFLDDGRLAVSDVERNEITLLAPDGSVVAIHGLASRLPGGIPYIAGVAGDTIFVFGAGDNVVASIAGGRILHSFALEPGDASSALRYVTADATGAWVKSVDPDRAATISRYENGGRTGALRLRGPYWSHAGPLIGGEASVLSMRGYVPAYTTVDRALVADSTALHGFDSPMLARMRTFEAGGVRSPPLLIPAATLLDDRLFLINARPGWLRVDVYESGRLEAILIEPDPRFDQSFYPTDIAARADGNGIRIAVSSSQPEPVVRLFTWRPR